MENKTNLGKELLSLGKDLAEAVRQMKSSQEFKTLEKDVTKAVKSISQSMWGSIKAAKRSPSAKKIQKRIGKVLKEGQKQGAIELDKAQKAAAKGIQKARIILKKINSKKKSPQSML